ncbi:MAG: dihydroneopterin aldolase [Amaricoccus sp.]|uniref:dihydroneopterin aldolase n=1 Tax=Amaricoccus sp. TaxID=1872485 RepID=UPI0039E3EDF9
MDETAIAFELPHARASATHVGPPLDRISVRDYTRQVEIGAFRSERGVTQRIRFNVVLEVSHHAAAEDDDVDKVISYDTITEAIETELAAERVNLLETLAERVAARCLADARAVRVFVRIEKLDRIPGTLGVEIVRSRVADAAPRLRPVLPPAAAAAADPVIVYLSPEVASGPAATGWRDALVALGRPVVVALAPREPQAAARTEAERRIGLLSIEQAAWAFAGADPRFDVAATRTELDWAAKQGRLTVWAPAHMTTAALKHPAPGPDDPVGLAAWLGAELGAAAVVEAGGRVARPADLAGALA